MTRQYRNDGRDQIPIENVHGNVYIQEGSRPTRSRSESLLLDAVKKEVISRLDQSLHNAVFINLGKQAQPQQVKRPWDAEIKIGSKSPEPLPAETTILEVFDRLAIAGRLLILGEPGAGKTTTMLDLAKGLCDRAEQDATAFIPVLLNLSSWKDPKQTMTAWLVEELKSKYGVRKDIGTQWLADKQLLPLLDGLDEVKPEHQEGCVQAINRWLESEERPPSLAVCCRREEYEKVVRGQWQAAAEEAPDETRMHLNGAILLQTPTDKQIQAYLTAANQPELWKMLRQDEALWSLIRTPLWLSITLLSYEGLSLVQWQQTTSTEQRLALLLDAYIERILHKVLNSRAYGKSKPPAAKQTRQWLVSLAQQLQQQSQTEFLIEEMQPKIWLLSDRPRLNYRLMTGLIVGLIFGWIIGLVYALTMNALIIGLICGLLIGISAGLDKTLDEIVPIETIQISLSPEARRANFQELYRWLIGGLRIVVAFGLFTVLLFGFIGIFTKSSPIYGLIYGLKFWLIFALIFGLIFTLIAVPIIGFKVDIETRIRPNQGIWNSAQNMTTLFTLGMLLTISMYFLLPLLLNPLFKKSAIETILGGALLVPLLLTFSKGGGLACVQHFALRCVLYSHHLIPWNYARFLDYGTERLLLQRVGGRYRFIHKSLQEHFAAMRE